MPPIELWLIKSGYRGCVLISIRLLFVVATFRSLKSLRVLKSFRVFRLVKVFRYMKSLRRISEVFVASVGSFMAIGRRAWPRQVEA